MAQRVDLSTLPDYVAHQKLQPLIDALRHKRKIVTIAGAGISASAGISTFNEMSKAQKDSFSINSYRKASSVRLLDQLFLEIYNQAKTAEPTQFHLLMAAIAEEGRLLRLYTQNIDGLDTSLPPLKTRIPLEKPWPTTVQLHGDLSTARCQLRSDSHLSRSNKVLFESGPFWCTACENDGRSEQRASLQVQRDLRSGDVGSARAQGLVRPRVWLYGDDDFPDIDAIGQVISEDEATVPDAVIVVGTAMKVKSAKLLARDMCRAAREAGGFTAWINLKEPTKDLDCFDLVIEGECESVAMHVTSWWLKDCPSFLNNNQIQILQEKCKLFITRSPEDALSRALLEVNTRTLSRILLQQENKLRVLSVEEGGKKVFTSAERSQPSGSSVWKAVNQNVPTASQANPSPTPTSTPSNSLDVPPKLYGRGEDLEAVSSDVLDESEEELVEVRSSSRKRLREKKSPEQIASVFADEALMIKMLREAVSIERASQKGIKDLDNVGLAELWVMISTEKRALKQRYVHYEFSRQFWAEMKNFNRLPHQRGPVPGVIVSKVMSKLDITTRTNWKYILQMARRSSVWTELADIFEGQLDHPSVVLCAVPDATYTLETMTLPNRKRLFENIRATVRLPGNPVLRRLKAADALYWKVIHNNLPASDLLIETSTEDLLFEETVSA